jgi:hypothetical protein
LEKAIHFNNAKIGDSIKAIKLPTKKYRVNDCKASACQRLNQRRGFLRPLNLFVKF